MGEIIWGAQGADQQPCQGQESGKRLSLRRSVPLQAGSVAAVTLSVRQPERFSSLIQIKIIVASEYINKHNPELLKRTIYGNDAYTSNSDAVCMLVHSGTININTFFNKRFEGVELVCKVIKPKKNYTGAFKNGLMSRNTKTFSGNGLKPESARHLTSLGPIEMLEKYAANMVIPIGKNRTKARPKNISTIVPIP